MSGEYGVVTLGAPEAGELSLRRNHRRGCIIHVVENLDDTYGGPARSVPNLAAGSRANGWSVSIHSVIWARSESNDVVTREALEWHRHSLLGPRKICLSLGLWGEVWTRARDQKGLIHLHTLWNCVALGTFIAAQRWQAPLVISPRGALYPWSLEQGRHRKTIAWRAFVRDMMQRAALIHVTEPNEAETVRSLGITTPIVVIPNGVEQPEGIQDRTSIRRRLAEAGESRTYLFLSRIHKKKGLDFLLEAWSRSKARSHGGLLEVAGPFATLAYQREIERRVLELGVGDSVRFLGMLRAEEREKAFRRAAVFVLPSHTENFGVAIVEALARGVPVITTTGTPWACIAERSAGWWLDLSVDSLTRALDEVSRMPASVLAEMGERAVSLAAEYSWERQSRRMSAAYSWLVGSEEPADLWVDPNGERDGSNTLGV